YVGSMLLGSIATATNDGIVYPQDLLGLERNNFTDANLIKLARFIQSLDDGSAAGVLTLNQATKAKFTTTLSVLEMSDADIATLLSSYGITYVDAATAMNHLKSNMPVYAEEADAAALAVQQAADAAALAAKQEADAAAALAAQQAADAAAALLAQQQADAAAALVAEQEIARLAALAAQQAIEAAAQQAAQQAADAAALAAQQAADAAAALAAQQAADAAAALAAQQAADAAASLAAQQVAPVMGDIPNQTLTSLVAMTTLNVSTYVTLTNADAITAYTLTGTLPTGLSFNTTTGVLSGTPTQTGVFNLSITATDNDGASNSDSFSITVEAAVTVYVKKTGQIKSYNTAGTEITDNSLKDDGYYKSGETPRYTRASDMVSDELTGLMWQDDVNATKQWLTTDNYNTCDANTSSPACYDTSGDTAATYCSDLVLGGYTDWRLPTSTELEGIVDYGKVSPAIDTTYFNNVSSDGYWSSTTYEGNKYGAWVVLFGYGNVFSYSKDSNFYVRCVRAGQ
ncbi:MAG: DUF1566 domain-containing protein, partial [Candidatus Woesearchaeota archaeon]|nr:DUF1566 domain-containing protein [Candidatus Woesearchaeota archaeon]